MILCLIAIATATEPAPPPAAPLPATVAPPAVDAATAAAFGDHLLGQGDGYNALTWYRLALFLDPHAPGADALRFREALAYERGERWEAAVYAYGQVQGELAAQAGYRAALCEQRAGNAAAADLGLGNVAAFHPDSPWAPRAAYARGALALERHDLDAAAAALSAFPYPSDPLAPRAASLAAAAAEPLPQKRPALAAGLSVLPGLGQLYAGHPGDAFMAAAFNWTAGVGGALLLADGIKEKRPLEIGAGAFLAGVFSLTWPSNVVGAYRGAIRTNEHRERRAAEALLQQAWTPELELEAEDVVLPAPN